MDRIVALLWSLWKTRNSKIFRNESSSPGMSITSKTCKCRMPHKTQTITTIPSIAIIQPAGASNHGG